MDRSGWRGFRMTRLRLTGSLLYVNCTLWKARLLQTQNINALCRNSYVCTEWTSFCSDVLAYVINARSAYTGLIEHCWRKSRLGRHMLHRSSVLALAFFSSATDDGDARFLYKIPFVKTIPAQQILKLEQQVCFGSVLSILGKSSQEWDS